MKTQDVPLSLREFYATFKKVEYKHDISIVFDDFLSATMNFFTPPGEKGIDISCFNKYSTEERHAIGNLIPLLINVYAKEITSDTDWYDPLGDFYMLLSSDSKKSNFGQFFTPADVVNLMTHLQGDKAELTGKGLRVNDPACGSGRFLIGYHAHFPGNYVFGEDIDLICCKMACINMLMHGCEGEVVHHDSLNPDDYRHGWVINRTLRKTGLPSIQAIEKENSFIYKIWQSKLQSTTPPPNERAIDKPSDPPIKTIGKQMNLF